MALPRFDRLPAHRREHILAIARRAFADRGFAAVSYNQLIAGTGISKTSAYQYFDSKDDLFHTVLDDVALRLVQTLGTWQEPADAATYWSQLRDGSDRLTRHLVTHDDDLALMESALAAAGEAISGGWLRALLADGIRLGIIRATLDPSLLASITSAVFNALDRWAIEQLLAPGTPGTADPASIDPSRAFDVLARVWDTPDGLRMPQSAPRAHRPHTHRRDPE